MDPDAWGDGMRRRRLVRAATLTGVMGVAWAGSTTVPAVAPTSPTELGAVIDQAVDEDHPVLDSSPVRYEHGADGGGADELHAARAGSAEIAPQPGASRRRAPAEDPDAWRTNVIATHGDVEIVQPSPEVRMVGFHEGGSLADDVRPAATPDRDLGEQPVPAERRQRPAAVDGPAGPRPWDRIGDRDRRGHAQGQPCLRPDHGTITPRTSTRSTTR